MSAVWVRLDEAQRGSLPARGASSGVPCITRYRRPVRDLPAVLEWALWTGLWPRDRGHGTPTVVLPLLPWRHRVEQGLRRARDGSAIALGIALVARLLAEGTVAALAGWVAVAAVVVHVLAALIGLVAVVHLRLDATGQWVRLSGIHPAFVDVVESTMIRPAREPEPAPLFPAAADAEGGAEADPNAGAAPDAVEP